MKIATWNVNSLNVRLAHLERWLAEAGPDIVALQETKLPDERFPQAEIEAMGYHVAFNGQKTYNGVAIVSREPLVDVVTDPPNLTDPQRRILAATVGDVRVIDLYVVNGKAVGDEKYEYKLDWLSRVHDFVADELSRHEKLIVLGDFNIAPDDRDVHDPDAWRDKILCSVPERDALKALTDLGLSDSFRLLNDEAGQYSWWDYRQAGFRRDRGLRIDLILVSKALREAVTAVDIDREPRTWERPSDHTPAIVELA
ncbi:MAG TPA: exodeoxyribonuclease III [Oleiagrimonas sp.]|nr:exodeoxyribonuclease III [Oleiagrimonas sp.]